MVATVAEIDGKEGGGQILRTALSLACVLQKSVRIANIRSSRPNPGIQAQHLAGILALAKLFSAEVNGAEKGSQTLEFSPRRLKSEALRFDIGTAGSTSLLFQALLPPLLFSKQSTSLELIGGTHVAWAPTTDYLKRVFLPLLEKTGARASFEITRLGWYPKGQGVLKVRVEPLNLLKPILLVEQGALETIEGAACYSLLPKHVVERMRETTLKHFPNADIAINSSGASSPGAALTLWAKTKNSILGASALAKLGVPAEKIAEEAVRSLESELSSKASVDKHACDQLLLYSALAEGKSEFKTSEITEHARTNMRVIEQLTNARFSVNEDEKVISVKGIGFKRR
ncbi:MAG: RNA 3'-terminal phosphate cyclase [Candidatus Micrarchaeota archaeon]